MAFAVALWPATSLADEDTGAELLIQCVERTPAKKIRSCAGLLRESCRLANDELSADIECTLLELRWWDEQINKDTQFLRDQLPPDLIAAFDARDAAWRDWRDAYCSYSELTFDAGGGGETFQVEGMSSVQVFCRYDLALGYAKTLRAERFTHDLRKILMESK